MESSESKGANGAQGAEKGAEETRWAGRPGLARALRVAIFAGPSLTSLLCGMVVGRLLPEASGLGPALLRLAVVTGVAIVVLLAVDRVMRRFLPLAALLKLSLAFPDRAPSRFSVALRAGSTANLERHANRVRAHSPGDDMSGAAGGVLTLVTALNAHDRRTRGHSERVRAFTDLLAEEMGLPQADRDRLRWAGLLHDVGKLHVKTSILNKPGKPTDREWEALRSHPTEGARLIAPIAPWLGAWADTVQDHHERWDGSGYPHGHSGEEISLGARMVAVADAFEVMTAARPYQRPVKAEAARQELARCSGTHFDPAVVRAFLSISIGRVRGVIGPLSILGQLPLLGKVPQLHGTATALSRQAATAMSATAAAGAVAMSTLAAPVSAASGAPASAEVERSDGVRSSNQSGSMTRLAGELDGPAPDGTIPPAPPGPPVAVAGAHATEPARTPVGPPVSPVAEDDDDPSEESRTDRSDDEEDGDEDEAKKPKAPKAERRSKPRHDAPKASKPPKPPKPPKAPKPPKSDDGDRDAEAEDKDD